MGSGPCCLLLCDLHIEMQLAMINWVRGGRSCLSTPRQRGGFTTSTLQQTVLLRRWGSRTHTDKCLQTKIVVSFHEKCETGANLSNEPREDVGYDVFYNG